jgi:hypothetical protein
VLGHEEGQVQDAPRNAHGVVGCGQAGPQTGYNVVPADGSRQCRQPGPEDKDIENDCCESHFVIESCEDCKALNSLNGKFDDKLMLCSRLI